MRGCFLGTRSLWFWGDRKWKEQVKHSLTLFTTKDNFPQGPKGSNVFASIYCILEANRSLYLIWNQGMLLDLHWPVAYSPSLLEAMYTLSSRFGDICALVLISTSTLSQFAIIDIAGVFLLVRENFYSCHPTTPILLDESSYCSVPVNYTIFATQ